MHHSLSLCYLYALIELTKLIFFFVVVQGYRVISVDIPRVWNHVEWIQAFEKFLDAIDVHHVSSEYKFILCSY